MEKVYVIYYKGVPLHEAIIYHRGVDGSLKRKKFIKKLYTREGYAKCGLRNLPKILDRDELDIMVYEKTGKLILEVEQ